MDEEVILDYEEFKVIYDYNTYRYIYVDDEDTFEVFLVATYCRCSRFVWAF